MSSQSSRASLSTALRVGFFLAFRQIRRSNPWTTILIIFIMTLTFLNLVIVSGILVGLVEGIGQSIRAHYLGELFISNLENKKYIEQTNRVLGLVEPLEEVENVTLRYIEGVRLEANYKEELARKKASEVAKIVSAQLAGIDPLREDATTGLASLLVEGVYLGPDDYDKAILGASLTEKYLGFDSAAFPSLRDVGVGSKIRMTVGDYVREVEVVGIVRSKVDEIDRRVFMVDGQVRGLIGRFDLNADEIAIRLRPGTDPIRIKEYLLANGAGDLAQVQTVEDAEPKFVKDIKATFAMLGNAISSIGLAVASITIFIVIFINAITRRKFIGILKGVGIDERALEFAYILQSLFYATIGTALGAVLVFGFLKPYFAANPIDFPFSDGILVATFSGTATRVGILLFATLIAGYIPARIVVKQNTLDAILGR